LHHLQALLIEQHWIMMVCKSPQPSCKALLACVASKLRSLQPNACNTRHTDMAIVLMQKMLSCKY